MKRSSVTVTYSSAPLNPEEKQQHAQSGGEKPKSFCFETNRLLCSLRLSAHFCFITDFSNLFFKKNTRPQQLARLFEIKICFMINSGRFKYLLSKAFQVGEGNQSQSQSCHQLTSGQCKTNRSHFSQVNEKAIVSGLKIVSVTGCCMQY